MRHVPHVMLPQPWQGQAITLPESTLHHLRDVLRLRSGARVSYTDGEGRVGEGTLEAGVVVRSGEVAVPRPEMRLTVAVAPPRSVERTRFLVEKLGELGADRLLWLHTHHGHARLPNSERVRSWARSALEQSRGAWLMETHDGLVESSELEGTILVADPSGPPLRQVAGDVTLAVGPEGGLDAGEVRGTPWSLGPRILRVETAAIVGAALLRMKHHAEG